MGTYRMGRLNPLFPYMKRIVAWIAFVDEDEGELVFAASDLAARAKGASAIGAEFEEVRVRRIPVLDSLPANHSDRDVIIRGCGALCSCGNMAYDDVETTYDEHGNVVSCFACSEQSDDDE